MSRSITYDPLTVCCKTCGRRIGIVQEWVPHCDQEWCESLRHATCPLEEECVDLSCAECDSTDSVTSLQDDGTRLCADCEAEAR